MAIIYPDRRVVLGGLAGFAGAAFASKLGVGKAFAQTTTLTAVEWGGEVVEAMQAIAAKQNAVQFQWVLHQGGAAGILPKIKASWPTPEYDYVAGWEGSFFGMIAEDWLETISVETVPNLADIPEKLILRNDKGEAKATPRAVAAMYFGYRSDTSPLEIKSLDDLFDPKLKNAICWPGPSQALGLQFVALALHAGGSETNMEPGWKLMADLAKSGNIGRVATTDVDVTNSLTSGETSVSFFGEPVWAAVGRSFPVTKLTKQAGIPTFMYQSGFGVLKNRPNTKATLDFVNFAISPEMNALYSSIAGEAPLNSKSVAPEGMEHLTYTPAEFNEFVYVPDYRVVLEQQDAWARRWEQDIAPLL